MEVPDGCGSEAELRAGLSRLLGAERAPDAAVERLQIVKTDAGDYALSLEQGGESRALRDPDCRALFDAAVIVVAVAIDPSVQVPAVQEPEQAAPSERAPEEEQEPEQESEQEPERATSEPARVRAELALGGGAAIAILPALTPSLELSAAVAYGDFGLALLGRYLAPAEERAGATHGVEVFGLGARLLAFYDPARFARLSAGVAADLLEGEGLGSAVVGGTEAGAVLALALEAAATPARFGPLFISIAISGHYALVRPSFEITGYGEVFRVPAFGGSGAVRVGWELR